jgi:AcrR family transcriptional regulator
MSKTLLRKPSKNRPIAEHRRETLLAAAAKVFAKRGYPDADIQEIADIGGVAKGTVYLYFPSKEQLFLATVDLAMRQLCESIASAANGVADPLDRLEVVVKTYFTHFRDHPEHAELLIIERAEYRDRKSPTYLEHQKANCTRWEPIYAELMRVGRVRKIPVERIIRTTSDLMYGTMFTDHFSGRKRTPHEQAIDVLDILFFGILTPSERRKRVQMTA